MRSLNLLCRVCGQRCVKWQQSRKLSNGYDNTGYATGLMNTFGIDITTDIPSVHSSKLCLSCVVSLGKPPSRPKLNWTAHGDMWFLMQMMMMKMLLHAIHANVWERHHKAVVDPSLQHYEPRGEIRQQVNEAKYCKMLSWSPNLQQRNYNKWRPLS